VVVNDVVAMRSGSVSSVTGPGATNPSGLTSLLGGKGGLYGFRMSTKEEQSMPLEMSIGMDGGAGASGILPAVEVRQSVGALTLRDWADHGSSPPLMMTAASPFIDNFNFSISPVRDATVREVRDRRLADTDTDARLVPLPVGRPC
jgi:hypothetical protein